MAIEHAAYDNSYGDPVVVLVASGTHDVSRLLHTLAGGSPVMEQIGAARAIRTQVRRHNGGRAAMRLLHLHGGPDLLTLDETRDRVMPGRAAPPPDDGAMTDDLKRCPGCGEPTVFGGRCPTNCPESTR